MSFLVFQLFAMHVTMFVSHDNRINEGVENDMKRAVI